MTASGHDMRDAPFAEVATYVRNAQSEVPALSSQHTRGQPQLPPKPVRAVANTQQVAPNPRPAPLVQAVPAPVPLLRARSAPAAGDEPLLRCKNWYVYAAPGSRRVLLGRAMLTALCVTAVAV